jgi:hypothetical protein
VTATIERPRALLDRLARHFDLTYTLTWKARGRSTASVLSGHLRINPDSPMGLIPVCLHEFAHLVAEQRDPGRGHRHHRVYFHALLDVITVSGVTEYPWHREYRQLSRWHAQHRS